MIRGNVDNFSIKELIENGFSITDIAIYKNINLLSLKEEVIKNNWKIVNEQFSEDKMPRIMELYKLGVSAKALENKFSFYKGKFIKEAKKLEIFRDAITANKHVSFNENIMNEVDTAEKAYWLGFFWGDAYNSESGNSLRVSLSYADGDHVRKLARFFSCSEDRVTTEMYEELNSKGVNVTRGKTLLRLNSKLLSDKIADLGCIQCKSLIVKYPEFLKEENNLYEASMLEDLKRSFIRGLFDANGSLHSKKTINKFNKEWNFSIVSTRDVVVQIQKDINKYTGYFISDTEHGKVHLIVTNGNEKIKYIMDWLHKTSTEETRLDRKFRAYNYLSEQIDARQVDRPNYLIDASIKNAIKSSTKTPKELTVEYDTSFTTINRLRRDMGFINNHSKYTMLGSLAKDIQQVGNLFTWKTSGTLRFVIPNNFNLEDFDIEYLRSKEEFSFYYLNQLNFRKLKDHFNILSEREKSVVIPINKIDYSGNKNSTIRNYMNRYSYLEITNQLKNKSDFDNLIKEWSDTMGDKYFQDHSGKNKFFINKGYHESCENFFFYNGEELVSFAITSPIENERSVYILGKALANRYPGLSDFTDAKVYELLFNKYGRFDINLGQSSKTLLDYKMKFDGAYIEEHYNGKVKTA